MPKPKEQIEIWREWIDACQTARRKLTDWESDFVNSIDDQLKERGNLSERQAEILEGIYANKT